MKKIIIIIVITSLFVACSDDKDMSMTEVQRKDIENIKDFLIPDSLDVKTELVIAAYYEHHPKDACVIIAYTDTTKSIVKKFSYSSDSILVVQLVFRATYIVL